MKEYVFDYDWSYDVELNLYDGDEIELFNNITEYSRPCTLLHAEGKISFGVSDPNAGYLRALKDIERLMKSGMITYGKKFLTDKDIHLHCLKLNPFSFALHGFKVERAYEVPVSKRNMAEYLGLNISQSGNVGSTYTTIEIGPRKYINLSKTNENERMK